MPADKPIQVAKLRWKKNSIIDYYFGAIQVVLSNGFESPVFLGKNQTSENMIEVPITPAIRKIRGTNNNYSISQIVFKANDGAEISKMESLTN